MADVTFRNESDGSSFEMTASKAARVLDDIRAWAVTNHFDEVVFWRDADDAQKYWVQLGEQRLNYWVHETTFTEGQHEQVESQMDYARGAQRRSVAGFDKFDK
ncbi:hypothetical protein [Deinococcus aquiradiocola]|uniref:Uncharacterized protein n=1 Tax=Deinococcus aquiradiocola TaxID=393059 RepID=A0A917P6J7_9DEIO|nr:hypothetical protein [Deinococcus aquiradiocola]GGJ64105.1 hypothetical protein GCM10008939_04950 [Deinococcus aquiradiocola]